MVAVQPRSLAELLGVKPRKAAFTALDLAEAIRAGLPVATIDRLCAVIAPGDPSLRHRIVPRATLARRQRAAMGRLSAEESGRLARLAQVWSLATDVWGSDAAARQFMAEPHPLLGGRIPREVATETDIGARAVEDLLGGLKYGTAV